MSFLKNFLEYTQYVEAPQRFKLWSAVSIVAAALERKVWTNFDGICYPNLYTMFVAPPGTGKSLSSNISFELLNHVEGIQVASTTATSASFIENLSQVGINKTFEWEGKSYHHSAVYMYSSEAVATLKNHEGTLIWLLNDFYDAGPTKGWSNTVPWKKSTVGGGDRKIFNICVNMLGCCTPDLLASTIVEQNFKSGFGSRTLFIVDFSQREVIPWREKKDLSHLQAALITDLQRIHRLKGPMRVTDAFRDEFDRLRQECSVLSATHADGFLGGYYSRKAWNARKLAMVIKASEGDDLTLGRETLVTAVKLLQDVENSLAETYGHADKSEETQALFAIWETLRKTPGRTLSRNALAKSLLRYDRATALSAMKRLEELGKVRIHYGPPLSYELLDTHPIGHVT